MKVDWTTASVLGVTLEGFTTSLLTILVVESRNSQVSKGHELVRDAKTVTYLLLF